MHMNKKIVGVAFILLGVVMFMGGCSRKTAVQNTTISTVPSAGQEMNKSPEDKYNESKVAIVIGEISPAVTNEIEPALKNVFGKTKVISYGTGSLSGQGGSFGANFKVPRVVTGKDLTQLALAFKDKGYLVASSAVESDSGNVTLSKGDEISVSFSYRNNGEDQEVEVLYWNLATE